jgi:hypothetical protein
MSRPRPGSRNAGTQVRVHGVVSYVRVSGAPAAFGRHRMPATASHAALLLAACLLVAPFTADADALRVEDRSITSGCEG